MKKAKDIQKEIIKGTIARDLIKVLNTSEDKIFKGFKLKFNSEEEKIASWLTYVLSGDRNEREIAKKNAKQHKIEVRDALKFQKHVARIVAESGQKKSLTSFFQTQCEIQFPEDLDDDDDDDYDDDDDDHETEDLYGDDDEEDDKQPLPGPDQLKLYIKKSKKEALPFACGLQKNVLTYIMAKNNVKKPILLAKNLRREKLGKKFTFGQARLEGKIIWLKLNEKSKIIPKLVKKMKIWLKENGPFPAKKARLMKANGQPIELTADDLDLDKDSEEVTDLQVLANKLHENFGFENEDDRKAFKKFIDDLQKALDGKPVNLKEVFAAHQALDKESDKLELKGKQDVADRLGSLFPETKIVESMSGRTSSKVFINDAVEDAQQTKFKEAQKKIDEAELQKLKDLKGFVKELEESAPTSLAGAQANWEKVRGGFLSFMKYVRQIAKSIDDVEEYETEALYNPALEEIKKAEDKIVERLNNLGTVKNLIDYLDTDETIDEIGTYFPDDKGDVAVYIHIIEAMQLVLIQAERLAPEK